MDKAKLILEGAQMLLKVVEDLRNLADSVQAVCAFVTDSLQEAPKTQEILEEKKQKALPEKKQKPQPEQEISLEKVRGVMAEKSRAGFTAEVRDIIKNHGADRLSEIDPKEFPAILAEAEGLK